MIGVMLAMSLAGMSEPPSWATYTNVRFGYSVCYPRTVMRPQPVAENGDGRRFVALDGGELTVFGSNGGDRRTEMNYIRKDLEKAGGRVTYSSEGRAWAVISGEAAGKITYAKAFTRGDQVVVFELIYPKSTKARYASIAATLNKCFRVGMPTF